MLTLIKHVLSQIKVKNFDSNQNQTSDYEESINIEKCNHYKHDLTQSHFLPNKSEEIIQNFSFRALNLAQIQFSSVKLG